MSDQPGDVASTLNELERRLRALERDLQPVVEAASSPPGERADQDAASAEPPRTQTTSEDPEQIVAEARRRIAELRAELDQLARTREQVTHTANDPPFAQPIGTPVPQPLTAEHTIQHGAVAIDAGFFRDITSLSIFEQSIARVPGVVGVYVRAFGQGRAIIDAQLSHPIALGAELARYAPLRFTVTDAGPQHLMLAISA